MCGAASGSAGEGKGEPGLSSSHRAKGRWLAGGVVLSGTVLAIYVAQAASAGPAAVGTSPGTVKLIPASGPVNSTPSWATTIACPAGYQGSALFTEADTDGSQTSISQVVDGTAAPFGAKLIATVTMLKYLAGTPNGGSDELFMICASGQGATGKTMNVMDTYITYSADGKTYTTSATKPSTSGGGAGSTSGGSPASSGTGSPAASGTGTGSSPGSSTSGSGNSQSPAPSPSAMDSSLAVTG